MRAVLTLIGKKMAPETLAAHPKQESLLDMHDLVIKDFSCVRIVFEYAPEPTEVEGVCGAPLVAEVSFKLAPENVQLVQGLASGLRG